MAHPMISRLLEQSNDVEKNPGPLPHRLVRYGIGNNNNKKTPLKSDNKIDGLKENNNNLNINGNCSTTTSVEDLKSIIDKQNEQLQKQNDEIKFLRKKIDDNDKLVLDFKSELSEVRKKWQSMGDIRSSTRYFRVEVFFCYFNL